MITIIIKSYKFCKNWEIIGKLKQKSPDVQSFKGIKREPEGIRTPDRLLRREMLYPAELLARGVVLVGVAGFEPATSCSQSRRDDRATLHPD